MIRSKGIFNQMILVFIITTIAIACASVCPAATITVDPSGGGDYTEIQPAIDAAANGDTVVVKPGEYLITEPIDFNRLHDPANPGSPPVKDITLKSEGGAAVTILKMSDTPADPKRGSVVVFKNGETSASVLEGFTLTGGSGTLLGQSPIGGGLLCLASSPTVTDCVIARNTAGGGGGAYLSNCRPTLLRCSIEGNTADIAGGVFSFLSSATLTTCRIVGNSGSISGGMYSFASGSTETTLTDCVLVGNTGQVGAGALYTAGTAADSAHVIHCTIAGNSGNVAVTLSSKIPLILESCIVWGNTCTGGQAVSSGPTISYSCIEGSPVWPGEGNINIDPLFCGEGTEAQGPSAYGLSSGSPCIGTGQGGVNMGADLGRCGACPPEGDTHCLDLEVTGPAGGVPGTYAATATARDDSGDPVRYTFTAKRGDESPIVVGPQAEGTASFDLGVGSWSISVEVDDDSLCLDVAGDASRAVPVEVRTAGGLQRPGDVSQDGFFNITDVIWILDHLFIGTQPTLPCEGGTAGSPGPGDLMLADFSDEGQINIVDPIAMLSFLFQGGDPPRIGSACTPIAGCPNKCLP